MISILSHQKAIQKKIASPIVISQNRSRKILVPCMRGSRKNYQGWVWVGGGIGVQGIFVFAMWEMCPNHSWQFYNRNLLSLSFPGEGGYFPYKINKMYTCISGLTTDCLITYASASDMYVLRLKAAEVFTIQVLLK